jgi:hypothetical protein
MKDAVRAMAIDEPDYEVMPRNESRLTPQAASHGAAPSQGR